MLRVYNKHIDALATLASKDGVPDETVGMRIMRRTMQASAWDLTSIDSFD